VTALQLLDAGISMDSLVPHRPPMQLLDRVIAASPERLLATTTLTRQAPFSTIVGVPACVGLEYLGQSAAAFFSVRLLFSNAPSKTQIPTPGMLIGSRNYSCEQGFFPLGQTLLIDVAPTTALTAAGLVKFRGAIHSLESDLPLDTNNLSGVEEFLRDAQPFAEGDLSVYLPDANRLSTNQNSDQPQ